MTKTEHEAVAEQYANEAFTALLPVSTARETTYAVYSRVDVLGRARYRVTRVNALGYEAIVTAWLDSAKLDSFVQRARFEAGY